MTPQEYQLLDRMTRALETLAIEQAIANDLKVVEIEYLAPMREQSARAAKAAVAARRKE